MVTGKQIGLWTGALVFITILLWPNIPGLSEESQRLAAVALLMVIWWVAEAIPIYVTAFLPVVLFPLLQIMPSEEVAKNYGHNYVLLLLGAFILAKCIETQRLHRRIGLVILRLLGTNRKKILLGFMAVTAFMSMWITNMAVVLLMIPIVSAIIKNIPPEKLKRYDIALLLGVAYAASIGGTGTLIGSPPNLVFVGLMDTMYPEAPEFSFLDWMKIGIPVSVFFVPVVWFFLVRFFGVKGYLEPMASSFDKELGRLEKISTGEKRTLLIFASVALGWIFRQEIILGGLKIPGWSNLLGISEFVHDSTVAMIGAISLFIIGDGKRKRLLSWKHAKTIPWGVAMFLGGGLALGSAFKMTGLASTIGSSMTYLQNLPGFVLLLLIVGLIIFFTEVNSNTATATIFLPILAAVALAGNLNPIFVMIPATFACSFAFMLPSGTGTNTVIFASELLSIKDMAKTGLWLNLACMVLLPLLLYFVILPLMGISPDMPEWAR